MNVHLPVPIDLQIWKAIHSCSAIYAALDT